MFITFTLEDGTEERIRSDMIYRVKLSRCDSVDRNGRTVSRWGSRLIFTTGERLWVTDTPDDVEAMLEEENDDFDHYELTRDDEVVVSQWLEHGKLMERQSEN